MSEENNNLVLQDDIVLHSSHDTNVHNLPVAFLDSLKEIEYAAWNGCVMIIISCILSFLIFPLCIILPGLFNVGENEVAVITYQGKYVGTIKKPGFYWLCPCFSTSQVISLKQQNFTGTILKVNDQQGNPIEIQMAMIWRIAFPTLALFKVQNYLHFIKQQSDGALKELAALFPYDSNDDRKICLLRNIREVNKALKKELNERFRIAGIVCDESALVHLHYPEEIAKMLLKRQEAEQLIASKEIIIKGIVTISQECIRELEKDIKFNLNDKMDLTNELVMILTDTNESRSTNQSQSEVCIAA